MNIPRTRHTVNKKGGKFITLSANAKNCLEKTKVGRLFFRRLIANHPQLKSKYNNTASVNLNCGKQCTRQMAIKHLDELGSMLIETGIAPDQENQEFGVKR